MNDKQRRRFERLARVSAFGTANISDFPETSKGREAITRLRDILGEMESLDASRVSSLSAQQQGTTGKRDERTALRAQLIALSDTAATIALDHPEVKGSFQWSRASVSDQTLLATARSFAANAVALKARFIEYDMPADFLEKLNASISNFEQHMNRQTASAGERVATSAALEDRLKRGEQEMERLDTSVRNKYINNPVQLASWESARRLEHARRSSKTAGMPTVETPPTTETSAN
ncbi:MAG TPA: hypothetical protein VF666_13755 [Pyrinomonadaceae bacterium]|jgi:hypothetical protein